jgi:hypothetical protein
MGSDGIEDYSGDVCALGDETVKFASDIEARVGRMETSVGAIVAQTSSQAGGGVVDDALEDIGRMHVGVRREIDAAKVWAKEMTTLAEGRRICCFFFFKVKEKPVSTAFLQRICSRDSLKAVNTCTLSSSALSTLNNTHAELHRDYRFQCHVCVP